MADLSSARKWFSVSQGRVCMTQIDGRQYLVMLDVSADALERARKLTRPFVSMPGYVGVYRETAKIGAQELRDVFGSFQQATMTAAEVEIAAPRTSPPAAATPDEARVVAAQVIAAAASRPAPKEVQAPAAKSAAAQAPATVAPTAGAAGGAPSAATPPQALPRLPAGTPRSELAVTARDLFGDAVQVEARDDGRMALTFADEPALRRALMRAVNWRRNDATHADIDALLRAAHYDTGASVQSIQDLLSVAEFQRDLPRMR